MKTTGLPLIDSLYTLAAAMCLFGCATLFLKALPAADPADREAQAGRRAGKRREALESSPAYRWIEPFLFWNGAFWREWVLSQPRFHKWRDQLDRSLLEAGYPGGLTPEELLALITFFVLPLPIALGFLFWVLINNALIPVCVLISICGLGLPWYFLNDITQRRVFEINRSLPYAVDLMNLSMKAGLDFNRSLVYLVEKRALVGPLFEEFTYLVAEINLGKTRHDAFQSLRDRIPSDPLRTIVGSILQAEKMGTPLAEVLAVQSGVMKLKRTQAAEKAAAEAPVKLLLPIMMILLVVLLTIFGGLVVRMATGTMF